MDYTTLITSEHADKPKFVALVQAVAGAFGSITGCIQSMPDEFDLDAAIGAQLDVLGLWIGQSRVLPTVLDMAFFGFADDSAALVFGELKNNSIGGRFYELGESIGSTSILGDTEYRTILRAKIVRNQSTGTAAALEDAMQYIFGVPGAITDTGTLSISLTIGRNISATERALLTTFDILPRPAGVAISSIS